MKGKDMPTKNCSHVEVLKVSSVKDLKEENNCNVVISSIAIDAESKLESSYIVEYAEYFLETMWHSINECL